MTTARATRPILLASNNRHKLEELCRILALPPGSLVTPREVGPNPPHPEENGETYLENALIKARAFAAWSGLPALADDSGLEVEALGGRPGLCSARYAGEASAADANCRKLLVEMAQIPAQRRSARFVCVLALCDQETLLHAIEESCAGAIADGARGAAGFGYDPIFIPAGHHVTFAQMSAAEKDQISHRGRGLARLREHLRLHGLTPSSPAAPR